MTLGESLALASGFYSPNDVNSIYYHYAFDERTTSGNPSGSALALRAGGTTGNPPRTDRGHLVLDAWAPYLTYQNGTTKAIGSGVPLALGVLDLFRAVYGVS